MIAYSKIPNYRYLLKLNDFSNYIYSYPKFKCKIKSILTILYSSEIYNLAIKIAILRKHAAPQKAIDDEFVKLKNAAIEILHNFDMSEELAKLYIENLSLKTQIEESTIETKSLKCKLQNSEKTVDELLATIQRLSSSASTQNSKAEIPMHKLLMPGYNSQKHPKTDKYEPATTASSSKTSLAPG